jgi:hypothetical protein
MRRLLWMILLFAVYVWVMTSGHDRMVLDQGKAIYNAVVAWLDDAEIDYQVKKDKKAKKRGRRWD